MCIEVWPGGVGLCKWPFRDSHWWAASLLSGAVSLAWLAPEPQTRDTIEIHSIYLKLELRLRILGELRSLLVSDLIPSYKEKISAVKLSSPSRWLYGIQVHHSGLPIKSRAKSAQQTPIPSSALHHSARIITSNHLLRPAVPAPDLPRLSGHLKQALLPKNNAACAPLAASAAVNCSPAIWNRLSSPPQSHTNGAFAICVVIKNAKELLKSLSTFLGTSCCGADCHLDGCQHSENGSIPDMPMEKKVCRSQWKQRKAGAKPRWWHFLLTVPLSTELLHATAAL